MTNLKQSYHSELQWKLGTFEFSLDVFVEFAEFSD